jgi:hypothetical protein
LDGYLFLLETQKLVSAELTDAEKAKLVIRIYDEFVRVQSPQEVNIDNVVREKVEKALHSVHQLDNPNELLVPTNVFYPIVVVVTRELR